MATATAPIRLPARRRLRLQSGQRRGPMTAPTRLRLRSHRLGLDTSGDEPRDEPSAGDRRVGVECGGTSGERRVC